MYWESRDDVWRARGYLNGRRLSAGSYDTELECALAINAMNKYFGQPIKNPEIDHLSEGFDFQINQHVIF